MVYVANFLSNTVSVIDGVTDSKIGDDIKVGLRPSAIGVNNAAAILFL
jgi:YVTN family beta-propeller protein